MKYKVIEAVDKITGQASETAKHSIGKVVSFDFRFDGGRPRLFDENNEEIDISHAQVVVIDHPNSMAKIETENTIYRLKHVTEYLHEL